MSAARATVLDADLPLHLVTPLAWAECVLEDPLTLLNDHAHLERKAAGNALELMHRWPDPDPPDHWVKAMTSIARDEVEHLAIVTRLLARRGGTLTRNHKNHYALALRDLVRLGDGPLELIDRLLVSALIEARSCERFALLAAAIEIDADPELVKLYRALWASERGHYLVFLDLAYGVVERDIVDQRWHEMLEREAEIMRAQATGARIHSWINNDA